MRERHQNTIKATRICMRGGRDDNGVKTPGMPTSSSFLHVREVEDAQTAGKRNKNSFPFPFVHEGDGGGANTVETPQNHLWLAFACEGGGGCANGI